MRVFISHSLGELERVMVKTLSGEAPAKGLRVYVGDRSVPGTMLGATPAGEYAHIDDCDFVVALISTHGPYSGLVIDELVYAARRGKPTLLLVERGIPLGENLERKAIRFSRRDATSAAEAVIESIANAIGQAAGSSTGQAVGWLALGALAAIILGATLSKSD